MILGHEDTDRSQVHKVFDVRKQNYPIYKQSKHDIEGTPASSINKSGGFVHHKLQSKTMNTTLKLKINLRFLLLKMECFSYEMKFGNFLCVDEGNLIFNLNPHDIRILLQSRSQLIVLEGETCQQRIIELHKSVDGCSIDFSVKDS